MRATLTAAYFQVNSEMDARAPKLLVLFPGALGDFVCLLPTLAALRGAFKGRLTVAAKPSLLEILPAEIERFSIERRAVADLFSAAAPHDSTRTLLSGFTHVHSWTGSNHPGFTSRLHMITGALVTVHAFRAMRSGEHAAQYYARCAGVESRTWRISAPTAEHAWASAVVPAGEEDQTLIVHAGSGSAAKNWQGFDVIAERWRSAGRVVWIVGPADRDPADAAPRDIICNQPLPRLVALLQRGCRYLGNDSGISHLAGAAGARGIALFGPSDPVTWRPLGLHVLRAGPTCGQCGDAEFCTHRLSVDVADAALRAL